MKTALRSLALFAVALGLGARGAHAQPQALYWLDTNQPAPTINKMDPNLLLVTTMPLAVGSLPEGLAISGTNGKLYWAEATWSNARIEQMTPTLAGVFTPVVTGGSALRGIAIDDTTRQIYWTSSHLGSGATIYRANLDGSGVTPLIPLGPLANPRGIAVDHNGGRIYWTDFDQSAIYSAHLDGTLSAVWFMLPPGAAPYGIVFDPTTQMLYWTEYGLGRIERSPTFAPSPSVIYVGLFTPTYITLDRAMSKLYWIDGGGGAQHLKSGPTFGGAATILPPPITTYGGIAFQPNTILGSPPPEMPADLALARVWPTPSSGTVHVSFALPRAAHARLSVLDLQGREVAVLADEDLAPGRYERAWDARAGSRPAAAGVYFARLSVAGRHLMQRIALVP
jgi:streptogramin lyase